MDLLLRIDIVPLGDPELVHWPHKKRTDCSATSITAGTSAGAERERKVGW